MIIGLPDKSQFLYYMGWHKIWIEKNCLRKIYHFGSNDWYSMPNELWNAIDNDWATYLPQWYTTLYITRITCCKDKGILWEKGIFSLNFFVKPSVGRLFVFCVFYSYDEMQSPKTAFLFSPCFSPCTYSTYARVSCRDRLFVVSGKGSSGLLRTKKVGAVSRLDDNLHTSISLQVVFSP